MEYLLQILGSIASIGSIPLAVYLYFRSREAKHTKARQEIVRIISFQVGEGRRLSTFEIRAVIDSKIRESRIRENSITVNEIIEDLVSETIMSPMLESQRKAEIIENLRSIHERRSATRQYHPLLHSLLLSSRLLRSLSRLSVKNK
jgi:hypothetical protein